MEKGIVTTRGRLVIPAKLRKKFGIKPGTRINFFDEDDGIKIILFNSDTIKTNIGILHNGGPSLLKALMKGKKRERKL